MIYELGSAHNEFGIVVSWIWSRIIDNYWSILYNFSINEHFQVVKQCCSTDGVEPTYIRDEILGPFFRAFWNHRMAMDRRNYKQLVDTTVEIAQKVVIAKTL